jgi:hypothetical protein
VVMAAVTGPGLDFFFNWCHDLMILISIFDSNYKYKPNTSRLYKT